MDEVDYEALRKRALVAREAVREQEPIPVIAHDDFTRRQATLVAAGITLLNIAINVAFHLLGS